MTLAEAAILGVVQGLTEFLPVSSSGHLTLAERWLGIEKSADLSFEVVVHLGTLVGVICVYRAILVDMLRELPRILRPKTWGHSWRENDSFRLIVLVAVATVPTVVVGLLFKSKVDEAFASPGLVPWMFLLTAALLISSKFAKRGDDPPRLKSAVAMGFAQVLALLPGVSRSGSTIVAGMHAGLRREDAGRFSFLMAVPAISGAVILEFKDIVDGTAGSFGALTTGFLTAFASGVLALLLLIRLLENGRFWMFAPYLIALAIVAFFV